MKRIIESVEPIIWVMAAFIVFFTVTLFFAEHFFGNDAQIFQVIVGQLSGFGGAFLLKVKTDKEKDDQGEKQ